MKTITIKKPSMSGTITAFENSKSVMRFIDFEIKEVPDTLFDLDIFTLKGLWEYLKENKMNNFIVHDNHSICEMKGEIDFKPQHKLFYESGYDIPEYYFWLVKITESKIDVNPFYFLLHELWGKLGSCQEITFTNELISNNK